jgi:hypothetical protein
MNFSNLRVVADDLGGRNDPQSRRTVKETLLHQVSVVLFAVRDDLFVDRAAPNGDADLTRQVSAAATRETEKPGTDQSNKIQHCVNERVASRRATSCRGLEQACDQISSDMEVAVLDAFEETLSGLLRGQSFVRGLDLARDSGFGLVLFIETGRVHRGREEYMGFDTIEKTL